MDTFLYIPKDKEEGEHKRRGLIISVIIHMVLFLFLLLPLLSYPDPPPELEGVLISFGTPDSGEESSETASEPNQDIEQNASSKPALAKSKSATAVSKPQVSSPKPASEVKEQSELLAEESTIIATKKVAVTQEQVDDEKEIRENQVRETELRKKQQEEAQRKQIEEENNRKVAEAQRLAEEEAARLQAEEDRKKKEYDAAKEQFGNVFSKGSGNTSNPGTQGDPSGSPNAKALEGISKGSGRVGDGLGNRSVLFEPQFSDKSQKTGRVVIKVCVDESGKVSSARFTQKGSTTSDAELVNIATKNAQKYLFSKSEIPSQCGTITVDFKLK